MEGRGARRRVAGHHAAAVAADRLADDMAGLVDWAFTLRMANASRKLFDVSLFDSLLYARLESIMQGSPHLAERHVWRLQNW